MISGNVTVIKMFLSARVDLDTLDGELHSAVHWGVVCTQVECIDLLCRNNARLDTPDVHGAYPLHYATQVNIARQEESCAVLAILLEHKAEVDVTDKDGRPPLMWAASCGASEAVKLLLQAGADVRLKDRESLTALHCGAARGHENVLELLLTAKD